MLNATKLMMLIATLFITACQEDKVNKSPQTRQAIPVRVGPPQQQNVTEWLEFTGRFRASQRVEVRARVSGYLDEVKFKDGQMVEKGDVLFVIDQRPFKIALASAEADFELASNEYNRAKKLHMSQSISEKDYESRLHEMRIAKAALDEAKLNFEFTTVKAPISGRVSRNRVDVGNLINGNNAANATLLTTIVSIKPIEFYFEGSEYDLLRYIRMRERGEITSERGGPYPVFVKLQDEQNFIHKGQLNFLDNELADDTGTIQARAIFDNKDNILEPGMFGRLRLAQRAPELMLVIPQHIIGTEQTNQYVYALTADNQAIRKYVVLGGVTDDGLRIVRSGLNVKDRIIIGSLHMVQPGTLIAPIETQPNQTTDPQMVAP